MRKSNGAIGGISFCGTLTLIFVVLKLVGVIKWSWLWVLVPMWAPTALLALVLFWAIWKFQ